MSYFMCALYTYHEAFFFTNKSEMMVARQKRKHVHKTLREEAQALKDIEKGLTNKEVAGKYNVSKIPYLHGSNIKTKSCHQ